MDSWLYLSVIVCIHMTYAEDVVGIQERSNVTHYPPQSVKITQKDDGYQCSADANPEPEYTWSRDGHPLPSGVRAEGNRLYLEFTPELNGLYTCEASNLYGGAIGHTTLYASNVSVAPAIPLSVIITICVIVGIIFVFILLKCIKSKKQETVKAATKMMLPSKSGPL
ncbi:nectin-4-like isoform X2 [Sardina pilchardus]|uniref:nectin-4-like isoform X2 n=1 Tax=Sardina pilchardus TaxID=27697 RepID=UPI002E0DE0FB